MKNRHSMLEGNRRYTGVDGRVGRNAFTKGFSQTAVDCPDCCAREGEKCVSKEGKPAGKSHRARYRLSVRKWWADQEQATL